MIILKKFQGSEIGAGGLTVREFNLGSHPVLTGTNSVTYTINHMEGKKPSIISLILPNFADIIHRDNFETGGTRYSWEQTSANNTTNSLDLRVYRISSVSSTLKVKLFFE